MKTIYAIMLIAVLINITCLDCMAQWIPVYEDMDVQFYDAAFPTDNTGYVAASENGHAIVLCTNDGGTTWDKKPIANWDFINKIAMIDSVSGYLIKGGAPGKILKTNDGFNTYTAYNTDSSFIVQAISLLNDSTGFYLNNAARLRKFEHNGASFSHVIDTLVDGQNLQFVNAYTGYLDTGYGLMMTVDAGISWNFLNSNLGFYCVKFNFTDSLNGYFSDFSVIYKTNDGGITFSQQYNFPNSYSLAVNGDFCMAANDTGDVAFTTDGGLTWQTETTGINLIVAEPYNVVTTPGGDCFLFSQFCGEIRKRKPVITGIPHSSVGCDISIYPNPFTSATTISFGEQQENTQIKITDLSAKEISSISFTGTQFSLDRKELPGGIYIVSIIDEKNNIVNKKIIIQ